MLGLFLNLPCNGTKDEGGLKRDAAGARLAPSPFPLPHARRKRERTLGLACVYGEIPPLTDSG